MLYVNFKINKNLNVTLSPKAAGSFVKEVIFSATRSVAKTAFPRQSLKEGEGNSRRENVEM